MRERIERMRRFFVEQKEHHQLRQAAQDPRRLAQVFAKAGMSDVQRAGKRLCYVLEKEKPVVFPDEKITFTRTVVTIPELFTEAELEEIKDTYGLHERGEVCNISVDYTKLLHTGFLAKIVELEQCRREQERLGNEQGAAYLQVQIDILNGVLELADKYRQEAERVGNTAVAQTLAKVPAHPPETFPEALQMFRIIHFTMWCGGNYHNTVGRFDQYMCPYLRADLDKGLYEEEDALELLEEFFLTFNRDSDLYPGMQQGDNGQSMVLGGLNGDGTDSYNLLSRLCLQASLELKLIDPKINLRVHRDTPNEVYELATRLTKQGLGFPQYLNDDVLIPGLLELGYESSDAYNYAAAACWEIIIPGRGMDIPNIEAVSFAQAVRKAVITDLAAASSYEEFAESVRRNITRQVDEICEKVQHVYLFPAPFLSLMMETKTPYSDISSGSRYNNYGLHGTGLSTAADSIAAVKKFVYEEKSVSARELLEALEHDFEGYDRLYTKLRYEAPKMGNDIDYVDSIGAGLLHFFSEVLQGRKNDRGGIFRAGTGSAMYYIWHMKDLGATPDGRKGGEGAAANYSPSLFARCRGPVSIIHSFTKPDLKEVMNGGPLTLELHDTVFAAESSIPKVAALVRSYMDLGGHQLQLNAVNRQALLDAQREPEKYRNLIVRVWGWSGYFVELDREYQDHIIQRMELQI